MLGIRHVELDGWPPEHVRLLVEVQASALAVATPNRTRQKGQYDKNGTQGEQGELTLRYGLGKCEFASVRSRSGADGVQIRGNEPRHLGRFDISCLLPSSCGVASRGQDRDRRQRG